MATNRDRFRLLFEHTADCIALTEFVDGEPLVRAVNPAFERTFGYAEDAILGENLNEYIVPVETRAEGERLDWAALDGLVEREVRRRTADGQVRDFLFRGFQVRRADGTVEGYPVYTDITERRDRERRLARENDRLDEFASLLSHDLRAPLQMAAGYLERYAETGDSEALAAVEDAHERLATLLDDLYSVARFGRPVEEPRAVALDAVARDAWRVVDAAEATLDVRTDRVVRANASRLQQLFENLFRNAVEHAGPTVAVEVGRLDDGFYVADDGPGVPERKRERIFETGYSGEDGAGIGLAIVAAICEAHGWRLSLGSGPGACLRVEGVG